MSNDYWGESPIDFVDNRPAEIGRCREEVRLASNWIVAIDAWDYCDGSILAEMLRRHPVPAELRPVIADMVSGKRRQNKKGATKMKTPAGHRMIVAGMYLYLKESIVDPTIRRDPTCDYHDYAAQKGLEPIELLRTYQASSRRFKQEMARIAGLGVEAFDDLCDTLREKKENYPNI